MKRLLTLGLLLGSALAQAHITLEQGEAEIGSAYRAVLRVGHGCEGSPTREIRVRIPGALRGAKPMPKPGWRLEVDRAPLAVPYESHGQTVREDVTELRWIALAPEHELADAHYDEFVFRASVAGEPGTLWLAVHQRCRQGEWRWESLPTAEQPRPRAPAVRLTLRAPAPAEGAPHRH